MLTLRDFVLTTPRFIVAHRGASGHAPENTLSALQLAIEHGAEMVEIDVRLTADNHVVLLHDHVMGRTTDASGTLARMTLDQLHSIDAGSWFGEKFTNEKIPLLREALSLLKHHNRYVNIEIKPPDKEFGIHRSIELILETVEAAGMIPYTLFGSFHHESLRILRELNPLAHTSAIHLPNDHRLPSEVLASCNAEAFVCSIRELTRKRAEDSIAHGITVGCYTVNTEEQFARVMQLPAAAIVTNYPERMRMLLAAHQAVNTTST